MPLYYDQIQGKLSALRKVIKRRIELRFVVPHSKEKLLMSPRNPSEKKANSGVVDKYAEARLAKKKQRRKAHRATIKRSNTGG
jgi:hypothetical protein